MTALKTRIAFLTGHKPWEMNTLCEAFISDLECITPPRFNTTLRKQRHFLFQKKSIGVAEDFREKVMSPLNPFFFCYANECKLLESRFVNLRHFDFPKR